MQHTTFAMLNRLCRILPISILVAGQYACKPSASTSSTVSSGTTAPAPAAGPSLPADVLKEIPLHSSLKLISVEPDPTGVGTVLKFTSNVQVDELRSFYAKELRANGWTEYSASVKPGESFYFHEGLTKDSSGRPVPPGPDVIAGGGTDVTGRSNGSSTDLSITYIVPPAKPAGTSTRP